MKKYTFLFLLLASVSTYAQNTINNYKYVLVPEKFSFLKQANQYRLNALTKALLEDKGFIVYYDNADVPKEIANNKCTALTVEVLEKNKMFSTNLTLLLKDCQNNIVFQGEEGKSREKEYSASYNFALRDAFKSLEETPYAYVASTNTQVVPPAVANVPVATTTTVSTPVAVAPATPTTPVDVAGTLYAQATANGYQLIDTTPKKVLTLFKTSVQDYYIANNGSVSGIVFKKGDEWIFEYYKNDSLNSEKLSIKF